jgi:ABC-type antimicrobial peptide transport system permease subunit
MTTVTRSRRGPRFVLGLYAGLVALSGLIGVLFSLVVSSPEPPRLLFLVPLPPTALGFAVYGAVSIALVLGLPLAGVVYVSRRIDPVEAAE